MKNVGFTHKKLFFNFRKIEKLFFPVKLYDIRVYIK